MGNRLYVGNLSFQATEDTLREAFAACGEVTDVHIVQDRDTGRSRGFAFVTMSTDAEARSAIEKLDGTSLEGRALRVNDWSGFVQDDWKVNSRLTLNSACATTFTVIRSTRAGDS